MWNAIVFSVFITSFIKSSYCIECYSCTSKENVDCVNPEKHRLDKVKCDLKALHQTQSYAESIDMAFSKIFDAQIHEIVPLNCLKQVTKVKGEEIVLRGCQLPKDNRLDVCKKVYEIAKKDAIDIKYCNLCGTDGCNGGNKMVQLQGYIIPFTLLAALYKYCQQ